MVNLHQYDDRIALVSQSGIITYGDLLIEAERIASVVASRTLVFQFCNNNIESIAGYIGFLSHHIVPVMLDSNLDEELSFRLVEIYQPQYIWLPECRVGEFVGEEKLRLGDYVLLEREGMESFPLHEDLALLMTTSGSTGSPKLVRQSYKNLEANTQSIVKYLQINDKEIAVTTLPMHYVYGLSIINTHLYVGAKIVVTDKTLFDRQFWQLMKEQEVTSFAGVPYTYEMLKKLRFFRMDLPALRTLTQAGGKLDPELHRRFADWAEENAKRFVVMYGAAEATARMGYLPPELSLAKVGSMGKAIPGGRFELIDESGNLIDVPDVTGELVYYGENVTMGYAEVGEDLAKGDERNGRYITGDMAQCDLDGIYKIVGRKKRFLKIFGKRTNLEETEHMLRQHFGIIDVACSGQDDLMRIYTTESGIEDEIVTYLSSKLGLHHSAFLVRLVPEITKNSAGKIIYKELEKYDAI